MTDKKKENDLLKAYEISSETSDFTPDVAKGQYRFLMLLVFLILGIAIAFVIFRILAVKLKSDLPDENSRNPIFSVDNDRIDDGKPNIPGAKVYDVNEDVEKLENEIEQQQKEFSEILNNDDKNLEKRNKFAAERLELLRKIDKAETKEARLKAIKELELMVRGEN